MFGIFGKSWSTEFFFTWRLDSQFRISKYSQISAESCLILNNECQNEKISRRSNLKKKFINIVSNNCEAILKIVFENKSVSQGWSKYSKDYSRK